MLDATKAVRALKSAGVTHVVWIPDSELGTWDSELSGPEGVPLIRVCREGEAFAVAGGLYLAGKNPLVVIQCTGLFEAGDSLRNMVHDLKLPLVIVVGVRSYHAYQKGQSTDTCPVFTQPILDAWRIPYQMLEDDPSGEAFERSVRSAYERKEAFAILIPE